MSEPISYSMGLAFSLAQLGFCTFIPLQLQPGISKPLHLTVNMNVTVRQAEEGPEKLIEFWGAS